MSDASGTYKGETGAKWSRGALKQGKRSSLNAGAPLVANFEDARGMRVIATAEARDGLSGTPGIAGVFSPVEPLLIQARVESDKKKKL